jgi:heterotetrameric sarcosine oxidase alpha subunit
MRIAGKGLIDRNAPLSFSFNGRKYSGFRGDSLASALIANDHRLVGRSRRYHRPRGIFTAAPEEPNARVELSDGTGGYRPNICATGQELYEGLSARSQNGWPSLWFDLLEIGDLAAPLLRAGFDHKAFVRPRAAWAKIYEPILRRAMGGGRHLAAAHAAQDAGVFEKAWVHCDLLVIGSGPAGLMAALSAARAGVDVLLVEQDARFGGRLLDESLVIDGQSPVDWVARTLSELRALANVRLMPRTRVFGACEQGGYGAVERVSLHLSAGEAPPSTTPRECIWRIVAQRTVLATGAAERPIAFEDNDRPGIMLASALRSYLNRYGVVPGRKVVVFANNDDARRTARDLARAGIEVTLIDSRADAALAEDFPVLSGAVVTGVRGRLGLREVQLRQGGERLVLPADCLAVSGGWDPRLHLAARPGADPVWSPAIAAFLPRAGAVAGLVAAGACAGSFSTAACLRAGAEAARLQSSAIGVEVTAISIPEAEDQAGGIEPLWAVPPARPGRWSRSWVDFAADVTTADIGLAAQEGLVTPAQMRQYTGLGMEAGPGGRAQSLALAILAEASAKPIAALGIAATSDPISPVSIAALGAGGQGETFAPQRFSPADRACRDRGAPMAMVGLWSCARYYPKPGETEPRQSCDREVALLRNSVGISDISSLGKIDIQGPDAGRFLDLVCVSVISSLPVGRARHTIMLREDGHVLCDGMASRLCERQFLITIPAVAEPWLLRHLLAVQEALCRDWQLRITQVTEAWAQFALAGPKARLLLKSVLDAPPGDFPFLAVGGASVLGTPARLFRISFSGEPGYEIAIPSRYGEALFRDLVSRAETLGGGPCGCEAMNVLRIERGFLAPAEMDGRTTLADLGRAGSTSIAKDYIGKTAAARPGLVATLRPQLVGLIALGNGTLCGGGHLFAPAVEIKPETDQGYCSSACWSPTLGRWIALAFLSNGRARHGQRVRLIDHLRQIDTLCEVCAPVFHDPEGVKLRA